LLRGLLRQLLQLGSWQGSVEDAVRMGHGRRPTDAAAAAAGPISRTRRSTGRPTATSIFDTSTPDTATASRTAAAAAAAARSSFILPEFRHASGVCGGGGGAPTVRSSQSPVAAGVYVGGVSGALCR